MADFYEWNNKNSIARQSIEALLRTATARILNYPQKLPFKASDGHLVLNWLRALADKKPSELLE